MYITAGLLNMLLKHFRSSKAEISGILESLGHDFSILQNPTSKIDANIVGRYLEYMVAKTGNSRIGLETGFLLPFVLTGTFFNIFNKSRTVREIFFKNEEPFDPALNNIYAYTAKEDKTTFSLEICINPTFEQLYPAASRQWVEMQCGFFLQYAFSFTGRFLRPLVAYSKYSREGEKDKLEEYLGCPVVFNHTKLVLVFHREILNLPIVTGNKELLTLFEEYMREIRIQETGGEHQLSGTVRRYLMHSLIHADLSLKSVAKRFYMSERNIQRKLEREGTSYQKILDRLRMELSQTYLKEKIPLAEISFLLGFGSQSAFNKFFKKHFGKQPSAFQKMEVPPVKTSENIGSGI